MESRDAQKQSQQYFAKCYGVLPLCLKTDATPHYHCPMSIKCSFVSFEEAFVKAHIDDCAVKPATIPEESYLICSKVQAFCVAGHDKAKKSSGQKHYHCAGYPECMHVNSRLNALKRHIFTCDKLAKRLDLYPVCTELACRHQYDETKFHYHCDNCEWTTEDVDEIEQHRVGCFVQAQADIMSEVGSDQHSNAEQDEEYPVIVALVSNEDDSVVINLQTCSKKQCMKRIDIKKEVQEHYHCPACEFCSVEREGILDHFNHIHYNSATTEVYIPECYALDVSCCAEKRVEKNKTIMAPVLHYHCPQCREYSDCSLPIVKAHFAQCDGHPASAVHASKRQKSNLVQLFNPQEDVITEVVSPNQGGAPLVPGKSAIHAPQKIDPFDHRVIECVETWKGCSINRGVSLQHYHCPYCTWSSSLLVNIQAHMPGCLEKLSARFHYEDSSNRPIYDEDDYDSPVEYPIIDSKSKDFINIIPCFKRLDGCARIGMGNCYRTSRIHWHCPVCTISGSKALMIKHFSTCCSSYMNSDLNSMQFANQKRKEMDPAAMRHSDSEDSESEMFSDFDTAESLTNVIKCHKKLPICSVDDFPGRPIHYHCGICAKPDLNRKQLEQHQVAHCLRARAKALKDGVDPNEDKYRNPPNVIVCRQREASCNTTDSKRVTHFHCSVCSYVSYRKDRAENHVHKAHLSKSLCFESSPSPTKNTSIFRPNLSNVSNDANDPCLDFMERCEQDIRHCKLNRKADPRRRAHWHCTRCDFVDYKRYRIRCHVFKNHLDARMAEQENVIKPDQNESIEVADPLSSDEEEDEVHGVFSCINTSGSCSKSRKKCIKKHWHCSLCNYWGTTKRKAFEHYVKCLRKGRKNVPNPDLVAKQNQAFLNSRSSNSTISMFQVPNYNKMTNSPLIYCGQSVYQCVYPLNTRIDDQGQEMHWHCPMCDKVGFVEYEGLKHYVHCSNFIEFHVKSQMADAAIDLDILQCTKEYTECAPNRKTEDRKHSHFHCPLCPYVDYRKNKVTTHYTEICAGKASSTHIMYCTAEVEKCSSGTKETKPGYFGHWHCSLCTFTDYNQKKVAAHYRDCYVVNQKYSSRYGYSKDSLDVPLLQDMPDDPIIKYPDLQTLSDKELTLLKIIPCNRQLEGCEGPGMDLKEQPLHYHCPICTKSDYLQLMLRHFPRCLRYFDKKRKSAADNSVKTASKRKKKVSKNDMKKARNEGLGCQMIDKATGIFVVRGSAVGLGFPVHVIFKKTHPKEFHCESGCEMQDRQLCKHLAAVEKYVRDNNVYREDHEDNDSVDMNEDFPDLDQIDLFHRITDEEKCDVYTLHNYCLENNTPVIRAFQTFKYPNGEETSCTFYSVCNAMFKGYYTRSGRVITTYNKKTHKYLCKCFYKECVHTTITKLYRASLGLKDCYGTANEGSINMATKSENSSSMNPDHAFGFDNLYDDCSDQRRFLKNLNNYD